MGARRFSLLSADPGKRESSSLSCRAQVNRANFSFSTKNWSTDGLPGPRSRVPWGKYSRAFALPVPHPLVLMNLGSCHRFPPCGIAWVSSKGGNSIRVGLAWRSRAVGGNINCNTLGCTPDKSQIFLILQFILVERDNFRSCVWLSSSQDILCNHTKWIYEPVPPAQMIVVFCLVLFERL